MFEPLASLEEFPLHSSHGYDEDIVWACDGGFNYDWRCSECVAQAQEDMDDFGVGDMEQEWIRYPGAKPIKVQLSWLIARSRYWGI